MHSSFSWTWWILLVLLIVTGIGHNAAGQPFVHPGGLHNQADLDRMKSKVAAGEHPWIDDWNKLVADPLAQDSYKPRPLANLGTSRQGASKDAHAAYLNAIRWYISGDTRYADCAVQICNTWAATVNQVPQGQDVPGLSGIPITEFALAGEVLRVSPRWKTEDFARFKKMMRDYWYPTVHQFLRAQNGPGNTRYWANWNICNIGACLAIGVLCDDRAIFDEGISYFKSPLGTGSIENAVYFVHPGGLGQWQESGRDQPHAELGVGMMAQLCEVAWKQGVDLYGYDNNRLLAGAEYVAQWDLWKPVPYKHYTNSDNANQSWPSINGRGRLNRPIWELLYNHYVVRKGLRAPNTQAMAQLLRLEEGSIDHFGYGTLTFTLDAIKSPYPPSPAPPVPTELSAAPGLGRIFLKWKRSSDSAQGYELKRADSLQGPYRSIASWANSTRCEETDSNVEPARTYYYTVAARNQSGTSQDSPPIQITSSLPDQLPAGWNQTNIGTVNGGKVEFASASGATFIVSGSGSGIGDTADGLCYVNRPVTGDASITARLVNVDWNRGGRSQKVGIMMRQSLEPSARTLVVKLGDIGTRQTGFGSRASAGSAMNWTAGNDYTWTPAWFRLERKGDVFTAFESSDGETWFRIGSSTVPMSATYNVGLAVSSNNDNVNTTYFDHVSLKTP